MTQFETLECLYNQLYNLAGEITSLVQDEKYNYVLEKLAYKDELITKFINAKKTAVLSEEEQVLASAWDKKLSDKEHENLAFCEKIHKNLSEEIKSTNKKVKMNSAYDIHIGTEQGNLIDTTE